MKKVLILVDNAKRDLLSCVLISQELSKLKVISILTNKRDVIYDLISQRPDGLIVSRGDYPFVKRLKGLTKIFIYAGEGGRLTRESSLGSYIGYGRQALNNLDFVDKAFLWGNSQKQWLLETGFFRLDQLEVVGCNRLDLYNNSVQKKLQDKSITIGIGFTSKSTSSYEGMNNIPENLYKMAGFIDTRMAVLQKNKGIEEYVWRDYAVVNIFMEVLIKLMKDTNLNFSLRVGPFEDQRAYDFLKKQYPGRINIVNSDYPLPNWIREVDCLFTCWSTLGLEFLVNNKPVVGMFNMLDTERLMSSFIPEANGFNTIVKAYYNPKTIEECVEFFKRFELLEADIDFSPNKQFASSILKDLLNWPQPNRSSWLIAKVIFDQLINFNANTNINDWVERLYDKDTLKYKIYTLFPFPKVLKFIANVKLFFRDLVSSNFYGNRQHYFVGNQKKIISKVMLIDEKLYSIVSNKNND